MVGKLERGNKRRRRKKRGAPRESAEGRDRETGERLTRTKIFSRAGGEEQRREVPRKLWRNRECRKDKTQTESGENETEGSVGGR